jgi:hypothetical protein
LRSKVGLIRRTTLSSGEAHREGHTCPRADYRSGSIRNTTCEGETEDHTGREKAEAAADAVAQAEERTVVVEE